MVEKVLVSTFLPVVVNEIIISALLMEALAKQWQAQAPSSEAFPPKLLSLYHDCNTLLAHPKNKACAPGEIGHWWIDHLRNACDEEQS